MKRLFLLLIFSLIGAATNPTILIANQIGSVKAPEFNAVETIIQENHLDGPVQIIDSPLNTLASAQIEPVAPPIPSDNISVLGRVVPLMYSASTATVYDHAASVYGGKFIYGHNSSDVFGVLYSAAAGQVFSVTLGGVTQNYVIADIVVYEKNQSNGLLQVNGHGNYMNSVAAGIKKEVSEETGQVGMSYYDLSLMTCYGTMLGGGDASHRLVIFAYGI